MISHSCCLESLCGFGRSSSSSDSTQAFVGIGLQSTCQGIYCKFFQFCKISSDVWPISLPKSRNFLYKTNSDQQNSTNFSSFRSGIELNLGNTRTIVASICDNHFSQLCVCVVVQHEVC